MRRGVKVCNVPGYATQSVAQFTMALILELATQRGTIWRRGKAGEWEKSSIFSLLNYPTIELSGKKLGIVGYGNIGQAVAQMARGCGLEILIAARPGAAVMIAEGRMPVEATTPPSRHRLASLPAHARNAQSYQRPKPGADETERVFNQHGARRTDR